MQSLVCSIIVAQWQMLSTQLAIELQKVATLSCYLHTKPHSPYAKSSRFPLKYHHRYIQNAPHSCYITLQLGKPLRINTGVFIFRRFPLVFRYFPFILRFPIDFDRRERPREPQTTARYRARFTLPRSSLNQFIIHTATQHPHRITPTKKQP